MDDAAVARTIFRLIAIGGDAMSKSKTMTVAARDIVDSFHSMLRRKCTAESEPWIDKARTNLVASFANGIANGKVAALADITSPWSNGQTEGQITKLMLVKRQMYGRGKGDLPEVRFIGAH